MAVINEYSEDLIWSILDNAHTCAQFDLFIFFHHCVDIQIEDFSFWCEVEPFEFEPISDWCEQIIIDFEFKIKDHLVVGLSNLENIKLVWTIFALTGANRVYLHASLIPNLESWVFETQNALRNMWYLISKMNDTIGIGNEWSHKSCKMIVSYSWLTHCVKLVDVSVNILYICCCHYSKGTS